MLGDCWSSSYTIKPNKKAFVKTFTDAFIKTHHNRPDPQMPNCDAILEPTTFQKTFTQSGCLHIIHPIHYDSIEICLSCMYSKNWEGSSASSILASEAEPEDKET
jgi:hypothetical protein